jgi:hypothetical protein
MGDQQPTPDRGTKMTVTPPEPITPPVPTPPVVPPTPPVPPVVDPGDQGFPANTPVKDMTPVQQVEYWKHQARRHEERATRAADYDAVKAERDTLKAATLTEAEKAVEAAKAEATKGVMPKLVRAEFKAAATGRIEPARLAGIIEALDLTRFLTATGDEVDTAKVEKYVTDIAGGTSKTWPDMGQGNRGSGDKPTGVSAGRNLHAERHPKK